MLQAIKLLFHLLTSFLSSSPLAMGLMLQKACRGRTGAPCDTEGEVLGGGGGGGVLKEFAGPLNSSLQIQATPGRSCTVDLALDTRLLQHSRALSGCVLAWRLALF